MRGAAPASDRARRISATLGPLLVGLAFTAVAFGMARAFERARAEVEFERRARAVAGRIAHALQSGIEAIESVGALYAASQEVTGAELRAYVAHILARHPEVHALSWLERVPLEERGRFEAAARAEGLAGFRIFERGPGGEPVPAAPRAEHFPVRLIEPLAGNEAALGFDIGSEHVRRAALERARATGRPAATARIALVQEPRTEDGVIVVAAVRARRDGPAEPLAGYISGVFRMTALLEAALAGVDDPDIAVALDDGDERRRPVAVRRAARAEEAAGLAHVAPCDFGGRTWRISCAPAEGASFLGASWAAWATLAGGLLLSLVASAYARALVAHARRTEELAGRLEEANLSLRRETEERARAAEERRRLEAKVEQAQRLDSLGLLAGGIAHDFNNLLVGILGGAGRARRLLAPDSPALPAIKLVESAGARAGELTRELLAYAGRARTRVERIDLGRLLDELAPLLAASLPKSVRLEVRAGADAPPVEADPVQLRQVAMNLIVNASDALGERGGTVLVRTGAARASAADLAELVLGEGRPPGEYAVLEVSDTGSGMDAETARRIFDPFFTTKDKGRGLGLAAVLGIVRAHRGAIRVSTAPGKGSTFAVYLPRAEAAPGLAAAPSNGTGGVEGASSGAPAGEGPAPAGAGSEGESAAAAPSAAPDEGRARARATVLVVDDEGIARDAARTLLEDLGHDVVCASSGAEALRVVDARGAEIGAVILDLTMPEMGGAEVLRELRARRPGVPVIVSSGFAEEEVAGRFAALGPTTFLGKPWRAEELVARLGEALAGATGAA